MAAKKSTKEPKTKAAKPTRALGPMDIVYGVPWIEVEFGERDEGWALFVDKEECFKSTKDASAKGWYGDGYIGPVRPLMAYEIPFGYLDKKYKNALRKTGKSHTEDRWHPKFKGASHEVK